MDAHLAVNQKKEVRDGISAIKKLPPKYRDALLAEMGGLLWMDKGSNPYLDARGVEYLHGEEIPYQTVDAAAKFVGTDGKVYSFSALGKEKMGKPKIQKNWQTAKLYIHRVGKEAIIKPFENTLKQMQEKYVDFWMKQMPPVYRDAFLVEACGLFHMPDGTSGLAGGEGQLELRGMMVPYKKTKEGALFMGTDGKEYNFTKLSRERYERIPLVNGLWLNGKYFMSLLGESTFLAAFDKEIETLRANAKAAK